MKKRFHFLITIMLFAGIGFTEGEDKPNSGVGSYKIDPALLSILIKNISNLGSVSFNATATRRINPEYSEMLMHMKNPSPDKLIATDKIEYKGDYNKWWIKVTALSTGVVMGPCAFNGSVTQSMDTDVNKQNVLLISKGNTAPTIPLGAFNILFRMYGFLAKDDFSKQGGYFATPQDLVRDASLVSLVSSVTGISHETLDGHKCTIVEINGYKDPRYQYQYKVRVYMQDDANYYPIKIDSIDNVKNTLLYSLRVTDLKTFNHNGVAIFYPGNIEEKTYLNNPDPLFTWSYVIDSIQFDTKIDEGIFTLDSSQVDRIFDQDDNITFPAVHH